MASTAPSSLTVKQASDIRDDLLRTIKNGAIQQGFSAPNVSLTTSFGLMASAISNEVAIAENNTVILGNQLMGDTATGTDLDRVLNYYGLQRRQASEGVGSVIVVSAATTFVPQSSQLQSADGFRYQTLIPGSYGNGSSIVVESLDTGSSVNKPGGTVLTWAAPPPYFSSTATVSSIDPISGGVDAEDDETARARLLAHLANSPGAGNPSQLIQFAQAADPDVQTAFVSAAARGPSTVDITVLGYATDTSKNRRIDQTLFTGTISPYVLGQLPQFVDGYVSSVIDYPIDISIALSLPNPITANPAGPGGGFIDASPLTVTSAKPALRVVDGYAISSSNPAVPQNTATSFWMDLPVAPSASVYNVSYLSSTDWTLYAAQTSSVINSNSYNAIFGAAHPTLYYVTLNTPFYSDSADNIIIQPGEWIFPTAVNTAVYVQAFLDWMAGLGPGERTTIAGLLPRAYRFPRETLSWPYKINNRLLKPIIDSGEEVADGTILFRGDGGTTDSGGFTDYGSLTLNSDPAFARTPPQTAYLANGTSVGDSFIFTPQHFAIYPQQ